MSNAKGKKKKGYREFIEENFTIVDKSGHEVPFKLNPMQLRFLEQKSSRDIILKGRQMGFSSLILALFATDFLMKKHSLSTVVADTTDNAQDLLTRVKHFIKSYERKHDLKIPLRYNSKYEIVNSAQESRYIIGTAQNQSFGRSKTISNLHLSEFAFYPSKSGLLAGAGSAVVPGGNFFIETTANGFDEFKSFWDDSERGETGFKPHFFASQEFYPEEYLDRERKRLGRLFDQEHPKDPQTAFITSGSSYFDQEALASYLKNTREPTSNKDGFRRYRDFEPGEFVVCFADTAAGGLDYCAAQFFSHSHLDVPQVFHQKILATEMTPILHHELERISDLTGVPPVIAYERNNGGVFELERLARLNKLAKYQIYHQKRGIGSSRMTSDSPKLGWDTNSASRPKMLQDLKEAIDNEMLEIYDKPTITEMFSFVVVPTSTSWRAQAESGAHDDLVMSLAGAFQMYQSEAKPETGPVYIPVAAGFGGANVGGFTL